MIYLFTIIRYRQLINKSLECFLSYIAGLVGYVGYEIIYNIILQKIYNHFVIEYDMNEFRKIVFLAGESVLAFAVIGFFLFFMKKISQKYFTRIDEISIKNKEIAVYILAVPWLLGILLWVITGIDILFIDINPQKIYRAVMIISVVIVFGMQLLYIRMLVKTIQLKEHLMREEQEKNTLGEYNSNLTQNMQEIRAIKHDIKNIFMTMGEYVARSDDIELKEYYQEKIVPFASHEFKMNDLYVGLLEVKCESLRAFLYYKMMQGLDSHIDMKLQVAMDGSYFTDYKNLSDIIRILGIFIDNAIEEAILTDESVVYLTVRECNGAMSFAVKNTVRSSVRENGVIKGTTTKGLGRGQGLEIAARIVNKYDDLLWNSYFKDGMYVQIISAEKNNLREKR